MTDIKTAFKKRFGQQFDGPLFRFGALVEYIPITAKEKSRVYQFGKKTLKGIFSGYVSCAGGGWSGDLLVADSRALQDSQASDICVERFKGQAYSLKSECEFLHDHHLKLRAISRQKMMLNSKNSTSWEVKMRGPRVEFLLSTP